MRLEKISENVINNLGLEVSVGKEMYVYKNDVNEIIGLVILSDDDKNILNFYILDKYQNNGYGKKMLKEAIEIFKIKGYKELNFIIDRSKIKAIKIITSLGAKHLSNNENLSRYIIEL